ncbi:hypothetical protein EJ06DRAFT_409215 [Trichodelitschia bisporula]|uniref:Uncharacterized protein n=1 Tax=Trichodelitschia bisporula TaxID=703511 RepID=A0A6G1HY66_9PEZI|nr:hypothetical protein EJ06DRAFT_409215 [Trichodelitschia bisporula]
MLHTPMETSDLLSSASPLLLLYQTPKNILIIDLAEQAHFMVIMSFRELLLSARPGGLSTPPTPTPPFKSPCFAALESAPRHYQNFINDIPRDCLSLVLSQGPGTIDLGILFKTFSYIATVRWNRYITPDLLVDRRTLKAALEGEQRHGPPSPRLLQRPTWSTTTTTAHLVHDYYDDPDNPSFVVVPPMGPQWPHGQQRTRPNSTAVRFTDPERPGMCSRLFNISYILMPVKSGLVCWSSTLTSQNASSVLSSLNQLSPFVNSTPALLSSSVQHQPVCINGPQVENGPQAKGPQARGRERPASRRGPAALARVGIQRCPHERQSLRKVRSINVRMAGGPPGHLRCEEARR